MGLPRDPREIQGSQSVIIDLYEQVQNSNQVKSTANPTYNHTVHFKISPAEVTNKTVVLQVWHHDL